MSARRIRNVVDEIVPTYAAGRAMLDIGSIGHDYQARQAIGTFYFDRFREMAGTLKGLDILEAEVAQARANGYDVVCANAESYVEPGAYDVIFAGELIEHLNNAGAFLRACHVNLKPDGVLILTTPNAFSLSRIAKAIVSLTNEPPLNHEHTCYYTPLALQQLTLREGFERRELYYQNYDYGSGRRMGLKKRFGLGLNDLVTNALPQFCQSFVVVLGKSR
jgi:SAM-dependent methyltransferase